MNLKEKRAALVADGKSVIDAAKNEGRDLTSDEQAHLESVNAEIEGITVQLDRAEKSSDTVNRLSGFAVVDPDEEFESFGRPTFAQQKMLNGTRWAKSVAGTLSRAASGVGVKALLQGEVSVPPAVEVVALPEVPATLLDLVARVPLASNNYSYLTQTVRSNNAAVVPDGQEKPVSPFTFEEVTGRARVVAHLSDPFPLRYLSDYQGLAQILDQEMREGVLRALEAQLVAGDGTGENFTGLLNTTGVTDVPFAGDPLTTVRTARTVLEGKAEKANAWVLHPEDAAALELTRENGSSGAFLMINGAYDVLFGEGIHRVTSTAIPKGTALLADWSQVRLYVREGEHTLTATQAGDLFQTNRVMLRSEGRFGLQMLRPQAVAVVHLAE